MCILEIKEVSMKLSALLIDTWKVGLYWQASQMEIKENMISVILYKSDR